MTNLSEILKAINNPVRMDILRWLKDPKNNFNVSEQLVDAEIEDVCVSIIQEKSQLSQSTVSSYLTILQRVGLVNSKRIGSWTYYKRNDENIDRFTEALSQIL
ncbi:helix-turn-helix transcriptional regulator [Vibrio sp. SS-MA-C1-2]|uniref:ArsR/SmtB family transcription factor n=1 Tax=Vibrio sp. SS-MA-C1-2 TaxID=2908646 RepID=UPI002883138E|nr:helix-turn-helix transcriptional regulator [Vibrio sp. SS-MA-C1-2]